MHSDPISSALTKDNRKESKRNHRRERQDITTTSRCVVWAGLKLILLPCPPFLLLSRRTKGPACASGPHNRSGWVQILAEQGDQWGAVWETRGRLRDDHVDRDVAAEGNWASLRVSGAS